MKRQQTPYPTGQPQSKRWVFFCLLCVSLVAVACGGSANPEPLPTVMGVAILPTDLPTLLPTSTLPPTSTPVPTVDAAATPDITATFTPVLPTLLPTEMIPTAIVIPTNTRFIPTNTPRPPTLTPTPVATFTFTPSPTFIPSPTFTPQPLAWTGQYFNNRDLSGNPTLTREDANLSFSWDEGIPAPGLPADNFSVRWTRSFQFAPGTYRFYTRADDGVRIWLDGDQLINEWHGATSQTYSADRTVATGNHTLKVEYYEDAGTAQIQVWWEQVGQFPQWRGEYYAGTNLTGPVVLLRNDAELNFSWGNNAPDATLPADGFSVRWTRTINFNAGAYRFNVTVDDGARFYLDGALLIDEWRDGSERTITVEQTLTAGNHFFQVEYYDRSANARIRFWWESAESRLPGISEVILVRPRPLITPYLSL